jgi:hypothetical protein
MPFNNPGLPTPPDGRQLPNTRISPVRSLLARMRNAARPIQKPNLAPIPPMIQQKKPQPIPGQIYKPPSEGKVWTRNPREILALIARFARERKVIIITYKKATAGNQLVTRSVEPYSLRYKNTKTRGRSRFFYGYDVDGPTIGIHSFLLPNIVSVQGTDTIYTPRWVIEF